MKTNGGIRRRGATVLTVALLVCVSTGLAQKSKKGDDQTSRTVQGVVTSAEDAPVSGAVVQLKNTKTLQIRSFIAKEDGSYYFNGLSPDVDYELRAESQGMSSSAKTVSSFDSRKTVTINLKLNKKSASRVSPHTTAPSGENALSRARLSQPCWGLHAV